MRIHPRSGKSIFIATRNSTFDPWIGNIKSALGESSSRTSHFYFSNSTLQGEFKKNFDNNGLRSALKSLINFLGIAHDEGYPFLYARDWITFIPKRLLESLMFSKFITSQFIKMFIVLLIALYRFSGTRLDPLIESKLNNISDKPDLAIVMPANMPGSQESQAIVWSKQNRIPSIIPVMTLDNLTSKGILLDMPTFVACWNSIQADVLINKHRIPASKIVLIKSLFFSAWQDEVSQRLSSAKKSTSNFLYLCSSSRIGGYRQSLNDRQEEVKTLLKIVERLEIHLEGNSCEGTLRIRSHPTFRLDPLIESLNPKRLKIEIVKGLFPDFTKESESLIDDLNWASCSFGMNTSAMLQSALFGVKTLAIVTNSNRVVTINTPHLRQLVDSEIVSIWNVDIEDYSLARNIGHDNFQVEARKFVGLENDDLRIAINELIR